MTVPGSTDTGEECGKANIVVVVIDFFHGTQLKPVTWVGTYKNTLLILDVKLNTYIIK